MRRPVSCTCWCCVVGVFFCLLVLFGACVCLCVCVCVCVQVCCVVFCCAVWMRRAGLRDRTGLQVCMLACEGFVCGRWAGIALLGVGVVMRWLGSSEDVGVWEVLLRWSVGVDVVLVVGCVCVRMLLSTARIGFKRPRWGGDCGSCFCRARTGVFVGGVVSYGIGLHTHSGNVGVLV